MGIVLKVKDLNNGHFQNAIRKLFEHKGYPTFGTSFKIMKLAKQVSKETTDFNELFQKDFADLAENGAPKEGKEEEFKKKLNEFFNIDVPIFDSAEEMAKFPIKMFEHVGLSPVEIATLEPIFSYGLEVSAPPPDTL